MSQPADIDLLGPVTTPPNAVARATPLWATPAGAGLLVLLLTLPRIILAARFQLIGDEAYYAIWSFHPGFGYFDHSPAVAWFIWLGRALFGEGELPVRSMFLLANLVTCAALYRIGAVLTGDRRIGATAAIAYAVTPAVILTFSVATPDGPSTMFWVLTVWAIAEFTRSRNANWWLLAGFFAGMGLLSKYTVAFLGLGILLYLVSSRERFHWLKLWQVWVGAVLAVAMFSPVIWIDYNRHWASFGYQLGRSSLERPHLAADDFVRFFVETAIQLLPTLFVFAVIGAVAFFARRARTLALPVLTATPMLAYFIVHAAFGRVNPNWTAPLFAMLALVGGWAVIAVRPQNHWLRTPLDLLRWLHLPLGALIIAVAAFLVETGSLPFYGPFPVINYVHGWDDLQRKVSSLAKDHNARWVDTSGYSLTGWLGYYGRMANDPLPVIQADQPFRYTWMPPLDASVLKAPHLIIRPAVNSRRLKKAKLLATVTRDYQGQPAASYQVFLAR